MDGMEIGLLEMESTCTQGSFDRAMDCVEVVLDAQNTMNGSVYHTTRF